MPHNWIKDPNKPRGWALKLIPADDLSDYAYKGGKQAHKLGKAHKFTSAEAKAARALVKKL